MRIELHPNFKKSYKSRIAKNQKLTRKTADRIELFRENPNNPILKNHSLKGEEKKFRAFSITGDSRIIYMQVSEDHVIFLDIGTHNQIY